MIQDHLTAPKKTTKPAAFTTTQIFWVDTWKAAMANLPARKVGPPGKKYLLARMLRYYGHNSVYNAMQRGSEPQGERREQLLRLAGPYGDVFARSWIHQHKKSHLYY